MPRPKTQGHGTSAAIRAHYRAGETLCPKCRTEQRRLNAENYRKRKEKS